MERAIKSVFQDPTTDLYQVDGLNVTRSQLDAMIQATPNVMWQVVMFVDPKDYIQPVNKTIKQDEEY